MIQNRSGTPRATSLEAGRKHCAGETEKSEAVAARRRPGREQREPYTDIASGGATDEKFENTCRRRECRRLEREGTAMARRQQMEKRRKKKETKYVWNSHLGDGPEQLRKLARIRPLQICPSSRVSVSHGTEAKYKRKSSSSSVLRTRKNWRSSETTRSTRQSRSTRT